MQTPPNNNQQLSIVILNWNVEGLLAECLRSLPAACGDWWPHTEVIMVDNASTDNSVELVRAEFPHVRIIALPENTGFSAGNNAGIRASKGRYIFLLNPDTFCHPHSIAHLCSYMEAHPETGIVGPRLLNPDGSLQPSRRRFPTLTTALIESTPLQPFFRDAPSLRRFYMLDTSDDHTQPVDWLSGAALLCRRDTLAQIGLFDPRYFMFSEEVDLCRRAHDAGWQVAYHPQAEIVHFGGQSTDQAVAFRHINFNTSKARYFRKHEGRLAGEIVRLYLLATYAAQALSESAKWLLGHKRSLRATRLRMYAQVLRSRLTPSRRPAPGQPILLITGEFPPAQGGVGDYTCRLSQALHDEGVPTHVLTRTTDDRPPTIAGSEKTPDSSQSSVVGRRSSVVGRRSSVVPRITLRSTLRTLRGTRSRLAHIQYQTGAYEMRPTINLLPLLLRFFWGRPTVVTFHDLLVPYLFPKAGRIREWANRLLARTASAAIATNQPDAERLRSWGVRRVELIPIGSNIPNNPPPNFTRQNWRTAHNIPADTTLLAYFGFLNSTKGIEDLLHALALLRDHPSGKAYRLMMVGGGLGSSDPTNRATAAKLDAQARALGLHDLLLWTGYLSSQEVSAALLSADMAVLPYADGASFRRGSLLAVLEHGLPLITTSPQSPIPNPNQSPIPNPQLKDGINSLLVPSGDVPALVGAIERLASDPALRSDLAAGARELARFFGWKRIAELHHALYNSLMPETITP